MDKSIYSRRYRASIDLLRKAREDAGLSQVELAERLGETQSFVSKCERYERRLDIAEVYAFCESIGIPFDGFLRKLNQEFSK